MLLNSTLQVYRFGEREIRPCTLSTVCEYSQQEQLPELSCPTGKCYMQECKQILPLRPVTTPGHRWVCHGCSFVTGEIEEALVHPYGEDPSTFDHWLYEHPDGDKTKQPLRDIHSSDAGGCYLSPVREDDTLWKLR